MDMAEPPLLTFLFTDIVDSTLLWEQEPESMRQSLDRHNALLRGSIEAYEGLVFKTFGDAFCSVFRNPLHGLNAALMAQTALGRERWPVSKGIKVRMALYSGTVESAGDDYFGPTVNRCARVLSAASGGQILLCATTAEMVRDDLPGGSRLEFLGEHKLKGLVEAERLFQLQHPRIAQSFPPIASLESKESGDLVAQLTQFGSTLGRIVRHYVDKPAAGLDSLINILEPLDPTGLFRKAPALEARQPPQETLAAYRLLGLSETAPCQLVDDTYAKLMERCDPARFPTDSPERAKAESIRERIDSAYETICRWIEESAVPTRT